MTSTTPKLDACMEELTRLLSAKDVQPEIRETVLALFEDKFVKLVQIYLKPNTTNRTRESVDLLQPSDLLLELVSAVAAHDRDKVTAIDHEARS